MASPPTLGTGSVWTLRVLGISSPACSRIAAMRRMGTSAMVMNMLTNNVERKTIKWF